jgi:multicomponent Na+:H+ antiporter subunit D
MVGVPPTAGFFSKFYLVSSTVQTGDWVLASVVVGSSLLTAVYFLRLFERIFVLPPEEPLIEEAVEPEPASWPPSASWPPPSSRWASATPSSSEHVLSPVAERLLG